MGLLDQWNKNKFSIYKNEEKTVLKLIESIGNWVEKLITVTENKTDLYGDHKGSWQGLNKPTLSEEGMRATVEKHITDIANINKKIDKNYIYVSDYKLNNTDDEAFMVALDKAIESNSTLFVDINLTLTQTYNIDVSKVRIKSDKTKSIIYSGVSNLFSFFSSKEDTPYSQNTVIFENIILIGNNYLGDCCIFDNSNFDGVGASRINFVNCSFSKFKSALIFCKDIYLLKFVNCEIYDNLLAVKVLETENSGENIVFDKCTIYNNANCFDICNINTDVRVTNSSLDYNYKNILTIKKGRLYFNFCHFEHRKDDFETTYPFIVENFDGNLLSITNSELSFLGNNKMSYIFKNNSTYKKAGIILENNFIFGFETTTDFICDGQITIKGTKSYSWENNSKFTSLSENLYLDYKHFSSNVFLNKWKILADTTEISDAYNGQNIVIQIAYGMGAYNGNSCINIRKNGSNQSFATAGILIPCEKGDLFGAQIKGRVLAGTQPIDIHYGFAKENGLKTYTTRFYSNSYTLTENYQNFTMGSEMDRVCPVGYNFFVIEFDLYNASNCDVYIDEIIITKM